MRMAPFLLGLLGLAACATEAGAQPQCPSLSAATPTVRLAGVDSHGDPVLADGRRLRLAGLAPVQDAAERERFAAALLHWREQDLRLVILGGPDRWGRVPSRLLVESGPEDPPLDLAAALLREKAAMRLPDAAGAPCDAALRLAEGRADARARRQGEVGLVDGHDLAALKRHAGRIVVLEGRVASVGERPQRSYLNFARRRGVAASVVMSRRLWREMQDAGWTAAALTGKRVRARGVLGGADGLSLELPSRAALELVD